MKPRTVDMQDMNDPLATATDIFKFETAAQLQFPTTIAVRGENTVPYDLEDAIRVLVQHKGVGPMTRASFAIEDVEPLCVVGGTTYNETLDRLLLANLQFGENTMAWRVRGLLNAKANPNATVGVPPVQLAISRCNVGAFYALLHAGADHTGAMRCAVKSGNAEMVRSVGMLKTHEEPELVDVAARCGFIEVLKVLVHELGYTVHQTLMMHPVNRAIERGQCDVVDFFFNNDASLTKKRYRDGRNALTVAAAAGHAAVIELLVKKYGMDPYDMEALCAAARHDRPASLRMLGKLLTQRDWMEGRDSVGEKPMMAALRNGGYVAMVTLAEMGADPFDVLFELARHNTSVGMQEMLTLLIDKQERAQEIVDAQRENHTLLSWAAIHGSFDCALLLMRRLNLCKSNKS